MKNKIQIWWSAGLFLLAACASAPTAPYVTHYLRPVAAPPFIKQVEQLESTAARLRSGDFIFEVQGQSLVQAVILHFNLINLSDGAVRVKASDIVLADVQGKASRYLKPRDVLQPLFEREAVLKNKTGKPPQKSSPLDGVVNLATNEESGSVEERELKTVRADIDRLSKSLADDAFNETVVVHNQKIEGTLYFERPLHWPATLTAHIGAETIGVQFLFAEKKGLNR